MVRRITRDRRGETGGCGGGFGAPGFLIPQSNHCETRGAVDARARKRAGRWTCVSQSLSKTNTNTRGDGLARAQNPGAVDVCCSKRCKTNAIHAGLWTRARAHRARGTRHVCTGFGSRAPGRYYYFIMLLTKIKASRIHMLSIGCLWKNLV